jgi:hypothetical protein
VKNNQPCYHLIIEYQCVIVSYVYHALSMEVYLFTKIKMDPGIEEGLRICSIRNLVNNKLFKLLH